MHYLSPGVDSGSSCPTEYIDCSIIVPVKNSLTERTTMNPISKCLRNSFTTNTAIDACIVGGNLLHLTTSLYRFVCKIIEKLSPTSIRYGLSKTMILQHSLDIQIFNCDKTIGVYNFTGQLMVKIRTLVSNLTVKFGYYKTGFLSIGRTLLFQGKLSLSFGKFLFRFTKIFRVFNSFTSGKYGKEPYTYINPHGFCRNGLLHRLILNRKTGIPSINFPLDGTSLDSALNGSMHLNLDSAYFRKLKSLWGYLKARLLGISNRVVSTFSFESWITSFPFFFFNSTKKIMKSLPYSKQNILKNLRMYLSKKRQSLFINLKHFLLGYAGKSMASSLVMVSSIQKTGVIEDSTYIKTPLKSLGLLLCRIESVFISLLPFDAPHISSGLLKSPALWRQVNKKDSKNALGRVCSSIQETLGIITLRIQSLSCLQILKAVSGAYWKKDMYMVNSSLLFNNFYTKGFGDTRLIDLGFSAMISFRTLCLYFTQAA